jgi:hypothetical protein
VLCLVTVSLAQTAAILRAAGLRDIRRVHKKLDLILKQEALQMALGQELIDKVTAQTSLINGLKALIDDWVANNLITSEQAASLNSLLDGNSATLEAALAAGTPPPPPVQ